MCYKTSLNKYLLKYLGTLILPPPTILLTLGNWALISFSNAIDCADTDSKTPNEFQAFFSLEILPSVLPCPLLMSMILITRNPNEKGHCPSK